MNVFNSIPGWLLLLLLIACGAFVVHQDYKAELEDQRIYCENVRDGVWPDYQGNFKVDCQGMKLPPKKVTKLRKYI